MRTGFYLMTQEKKMFVMVKCGATLNLYARTPVPVALTNTTFGPLSVRNKLNQLDSTDR